MQKIALCEVCKVLEQVTFVGGFKGLCTAENDVPLCDIFQLLCAFENAFFPCVHKMLLKSTMILIIHGCLLSSFIHAMSKTLD